MTKNDLIALANETHDKVEKLRDEMTHAVDEVSKVEGDEVSDLFYLPTTETECYILFNRLKYALNNFAHRLSDVKDLPENTLVMCKGRESHLEGWRVQYYWQKGITLSSMGDTAEHSGWLYIVPFRYFTPDSPDWRPEDKCNWANFREGKK